MFIKSLSLITCELTNFDFLIVHTILITILCPSILRGTPFSASILPGLVDHLTRTPNIVGLGVNLRPSYEQMHYGPATSGHSFSVFRPCKKVGVNNRWSYFAIRRTMVQNTWRTSLYV